VQVQRGWGVGVDTTASNSTTITTEIETNAIESHMKHRKPQRDRERQEERKEESEEEEEVGVEEKRRRSVCRGLVLELLERVLETRELKLEV
jgi:hypothetical protein